MGEQQQGQQGSEGTNGDGGDAGTLRANFEAQLGEKDTTIGLLQKQLAIATAIPGIDPNAKPVVAMLQQYSGELTPEALLTEAKEWNISAPASQTQGNEQQTGNEGQGNQVPDAERQAHQQTQSFGQGSQDQGGAKDGPSPVDAGLDAFHEALKGGQTREEAASQFLGKIFEAARKGDERVIVPVGRDERLENAGA